MEDRLRRRLHQAFDRPDFPAADLVARSVARLDEEPERGHRREWAVALAALVLALAVLATFVVISQRFVPKPLPATSPSPTAGMNVAATESGKRVYPVSPEVAWRITVQAGPGPTSTPPPTTLSKTTDGGRTWTDQVSWTGGDPIYARFDDARTGLVVRNEPGGASGVYRTTDGVTWTKKPTPVKVQSASFVSAREGWVSSASDRGIYHTTDGGQTWKLGGFLRGSGEGAGGQLYFADSSTGYVGNPEQGRWPPMDVTHNGGASWSAAEMARPAGLTPTTQVSVFEVRIVDGRSAFAVVQTYTSTKSAFFLYFTGDSGRTWTEPRSLPDSSFSTLQAVDANHLWLAGAELWRSADGGQSWTRVPASLPPAPAAYKNPEYHFYGIQFAGPDVGWAGLWVQERCVGRTGFGQELGWPPCGAQGPAVRFTVIKTTDGGRTWIEVAPLS